MQIYWRRNPCSQGRTLLSYSINLFSKQHQSSSKKQLPEIILSSENKTLRPPTTWNMDLITKTLNWNENLWLLTHSQGLVYLLSHNPGGRSSFPAGCGWQRISNQWMWCVLLYTVYLDSCQCLLPSSPPLSTARCVAVVRLQGWLHLYFSPRSS